MQPEGNSSPTGPSWLRLLPGGARHLGLQMLEVHRSVEKSPTVTVFWPVWIFWVIDSVKISRHVPKAVHGIVVKATAQQHFPGALKRRVLPGQRNSVAWVARGGELLASCWCVECSWCWNPSLLKYQQFILEMIFWASHIICLLENPRALQCPFLLERIWHSETCFGTVTGKPRLTWNAYRSHGRSPNAWNSWCLH